MADKQDMKTMNAEVSAIEFGSDENNKRLVRVHLAPIVISAEEYVQLQQVMGVDQTIRLRPA